MSINPDTIRQALVPAPCDCARVSLNWVTVAGPGMVQGPLDDVPRPVDGPTGSSGAGAVLTIDGHSFFLKSA